MSATMSDPVGRGAAEPAATDAAAKAMNEHGIAAERKLECGCIQWSCECGRIFGAESAAEHHCARAVVDAVLAAVASDTPTYDPIPGWSYDPHCRPNGHVHREDSHGVCVDCQPVFRRVPSPHTDSSAT